MGWSINHDVIHYISSLDAIIETSSPITPGQSVLLRKGNNEFTVRLDSSEDNSYKGTVISIGPIPCLEADGTTRGETVSFNKTNIFRVYLDTKGMQ